MRPRDRLLALLAATASTLVFVATVLWSQRSSVFTAALLLAVVWGATICVIDAFAVWHTPVALQPSPERRVPLTYVMRLGEEHLDIARTSVLLASQAGPVVVVATRHHELLDELDGVGVREFLAPTITEALNDAAHTIATDAVLLLSASAFPLGDACEMAAGRVADDVGWVIGNAPAFNNDRYAPGERELLSARVRTASRGLGLVTWEPDATIVRTRLLREHPLENGRPYGSWLRDRAAAGWRGVAVPEALAVRAAPADAPVFWPTQTKRRRGTVADLAAATTTGALRPRLLAFGALLRELYAYPIVLWMLVIVLIGRSGAFPLWVSPVAFFAIQGTLAAVRWVSIRFVYGIGLHPVNEAREAAYDVPGSFLALGSALTRRVRPIRLHVPDQPMLWVALLVTLLTTVPLLDRRTPTGSAVGIAVGLVVTAIAGTWLFALRAFGAQGWDRASYRLAVDLPATIDGQPARTVDASPSGLAVIGAPASLVRGARASVSVAFDETGTSTVSGRVTDIRRIGDRTAAGLALDLDTAERSTWVRNLFAAAGVTTRMPTLPVAPSSHLVFDRERTSVQRRIAIALQVGVVGAVSALVFSALLLAMLGYRPMVVRSGSMMPTLGVGDVVVADWVRVDHVRTGEIVTFNSEFGRPELITHRVEGVRVSGDTVNVITKGDANADPERWSVPRATLVGHVMWTIPRVGSLLVVLGETTTRLVLFGASTAVALGAALASALRRNRALSAAHGLS